MAAPPARRPTDQEPRGRAQPPAPGTPGWRVTPAPDGRGAKRVARTPRPPRSRWWIAVVVVALFAVNLWVSSQALKPNAPIKIPYSPTFLNQVTKKNVASINS